MDGVPGDAALVLEKERRLGQSPPPHLALALAADELLHAAIRFVVGHLHGRMFRKKG
jgi:hypothetical protein